ncbi:MAG: ABC transporter permease [Clostridiales bacterium]|nr:ABC transporter permease [Clostridiales bacterium]
MKWLHNLYRYRYLLYEIVRKNIKLQYRDSVLGILWTFLQPLMTTIILVVVFGNVFGKSNAGIINYPIYLLCGRLLYEFYSQSTKRAMRSIRNSASVIKKVYVPKYIYPIANVISNFVTFLISLSVLLCFIVFFLIVGENPPHITLYALLAPVPVIILFILAVGVGLILSTMDVFFKDTDYLYEVFCLLLFYLTPIFYKVESLGMKNEVFKVMLMANPLYSITEMFRCCVLYGKMFNIHHLLYSFGFSVATVLLGSLVFYKKQDKFILHM